MSQFCRRKPGRPNAPAARPAARRPRARLLLHALEAREVGQVLLEARRHFMDLQNPLGLAYTLYGSAATKLESAVV